MRVWTTPGKQKQGEFALGVASNVIPFYNEYFDIEYPLPKADLVAIPDFAIGGLFHVSHVLRWCFSSCISWYFFFCMFDWVLLCVFGHVQVS